MSDTGTAIAPLTIAILSKQCLVWLGLQKILESSTTLPMVVQPHAWRTPDGSLPATQPDVFILDLETEPDAIGTLTQIRASAPTSKIVLLCGLEDQDRAREAFAAGVDGILLKVQPPAVVLAAVEALYTPAPSKAHMAREGVALGTSIKPRVEGTLHQPAWPDALTEREREIIRLVGQGLSNKDIAYKLSISDSTVRHHMTNIFDKVGVPNRQKLLLHAHHVRSSML